MSTRHHDGECRPSDPYLDAEGNPAFCCKVKSLRFDPRATRATAGYRGSSSTAKNSWEAGIAGERRADGSFMPYVDKRHKHIGVKEFAEKRSTLEQIRSRQLSSSS